MKPIRFWQNVDRELFDNEIRPLGQPAVLKGFCNFWPAVEFVKNGNEALAQYLNSCSKNQIYRFARVKEPEENCFHYDNDLHGLNFDWFQTNLPDFFKLLLSQNKDKTQSMALQGMSIKEYLPQFAIENSNPILGQNFNSLMWVSNASNVATHQDPFENIACVIAGKRRFTVFPPAQIKNLYMGPLHFTPAGNPISMVHLTKPDFEKYPKFKNALEEAQFADIEIGDAIYLPYHWFHHVSSIEPFNILVNYWWTDARTDIGSTWDALMSSMLSIGNLPLEQRLAWREVFNNYVFFQDEMPFEHLPKHAQGPVLNLKPEDCVKVKRAIIEAMLKR